MLWSLGLELQAAVSHGVGAGNPTQVLWKSNKCSLPLVSLAPQLCVLLNHCKWAVFSWFVSQPASSVEKLLVSFCVGLRVLLLG